MANNKVVFGQEVLIDLTQDTVTPYALEEGYTAHAPSGEKIVGVMKPNKPVEVATNAEMTAISTGATEKDLGKVYLFVGEDDGVFEKDALYILVKKGTGYGFTRYAIGGSGEAGEDLTAVLDEQSQLIAELKEKLANGGGGSQECDCIIDVTELPEQYKDVNVYVRFDESTYMTFLQLFQVEGLNPAITYYVVDELPTEGTVTDFNTLALIYVYIANNIPYAYGDVGSGNMWLPISTLMAEIADITLPDNGFTSDITTTTAPGIYVTYKEGEKPVEGVVYRLTPPAQLAVYLAGEGAAMSIVDVFLQLNMAIIVSYKLVDDVPTSIPVSRDNTLYVCVVKPTGIAYVSTDSPENVVPLSKALVFAGDIPDKGWTTDLYGETETGWYSALQPVSPSYCIYADGVWSEYKLGGARNLASVLLAETEIVTAKDLEGVTSIKQYAFSASSDLSYSTTNGLRNPRSSRLKEITLHDKIIEICDYAFEGCLLLQKITIPASVSYIGSHAFERTGIKTFVFKGTPIAIGPDCFGKNYSVLEHIYVPWAAGAVAGAPWGAPNAAIHYNTDTSLM